MIKNLNFSLILLIFLILQFSFSQEEFCKTNQNDLIVPETGCTLIESEETLVKEIILYGELKINRRNHLKYESIKVKSKKAGIKITSEYEKIVIEDISTDACDFATVQVQDEINLNFASSAKNELFDIEYVKQNTYKVVNRLASILSRGVSVIIFNEYEYKITQIMEISGENVILEDELLEKESTIYKKSGDSVVSKIFHQMLLFDDNTIIFKNNCLRIYSNQNGFGPSHGIIFLNLRALIYETDMQRDQVNIFDMIVFDSFSTSEIQSNIQIQANIKDIILMGQGKSISLTSLDTIRRLFIVHQQIFKIRIEVDLYNDYSTIDTKIYGSNGQIQFPFQVFFNHTIIANSKLDFEMEGSRLNVDFINGVLTQSSRLDKMINIHQVSFYHFVLQQQLNFSLCPDCSLQLEKCIFDGTGLNGAIRVEKNWYFIISINEVQFFNFEKSKLPLIYSLAGKDSFEQPYDRYDHAVLIYKTTYAFDKTNKKLINVDQISFITDYFNNNWSRYLVSSLDEKLYYKKNHLKYKDPFFSEKQLNLFEDSKQSYRALKFQMKDGPSLYDIVVEIQNGKTSYNFNEKIHILGYYEYNIYFKLKENKVAPTKQDLKILSKDFSPFQKKNYQNVRIFFDSQQPLQDISIDKSDEIFFFNELDNSIQINFNPLKNSIDFDFTLQFCNKGLVIENHQCVSSCSDKTINPILGVCFDQTKPHPRYYQTKNSDNKIDLNPCSWYCADCKNNSTCNSCVKNFEKNNCRDVNEGEFVSSNQQIEQCEDNCKRCDSKENCLTCNENMGVDNGICKPLMSNQYIEYSIIQNCPNYCKKCYSKEFCSECKDGYQQILGKCVKKCEFGYFQNGESCEQCSSNEKKCDDEINKTCYVGYVLNKDKYKCEKSKVPEPSICDGISCYPCSIKGYYFSLKDQKCLQCNKICSECKNDANQCTSCAKNYYFSLQDQKCLKCNEKCSECKNDANLCTSCAKGYLFIDGVCSQCPEQHIQINNSCQKCSSGYFSDKIKNECQLCNSNCKECISSDICISCNQGFYLENQQCLPCSENCNDCKDFSFCLSCLSEDFQLQKNTCIKVAESDSDQNQVEMIIGIVLGCIFGGLTICLCIFIAIKRQRQKKKKRINPELSGQQVDSKVKIDTENIQNNIPTLTNLNYNMFSIENLETQQIILPAEQNKEIIQTVTSI